MFKIIIILSFSFLEVHFFQLYFFFPCIFFSWSLWILEIPSWVPKQCTAVHGVTKSWTRLSDWTMKVYLYLPGGSVLKNLPAKQKMQGRSLSEEDPLEKKMATHSSILAWEMHGQRSVAGYSWTTTKFIYWTTTKFL